MSEITYTKPVLHTYKNDLNKSWFVGFDVTNNETGEKVRKQIRGNINRSNKLSERLKEGNLLVDFYTEYLKNGWSPFQTASNELVKMSFNEAIDWALAKCVVAKKTKLDYKGTAEFIKAAAKKLNLSDSKIAGIKRQHIKLLLDQVKTDRKWSNHAYNKNLGYLSGILSRLTEYEVIENNPAFGINSLPVAETNMYEPLTDKEKETVKKHLIENYPKFFVITMIIFHTGIRPKEVLLLKVSDVLLKDRKIKIVPDIEKENSKTKKIRIVPINNHLFELLNNLNLDKYPKDFYVFGGAIGFGPADDQYFNPSLVPVKRDTITKFWKTVVIDGLGIKKYLYGLKHTGANSKIRAGISVDVLQDLYGHSSKLMTKKYINDVQDFYHKEIIDKSPDF